MRDKTDDENTTLLNRAEVARRLGIAPTTLDIWVTKGLFPKPLFLTPGRTTRRKWRLATLSAFLDKRAVSRRPTPEPVGARAAPARVKRVARVKREGRRS